jgi:hypothetical protein
VKHSTVAGESNIAVVERRIGIKQYGLSLANSFELSAHLSAL